MQQRKVIQPVMGSFTPCIAASQRTVNGHILKETNQVRHHYLYRDSAERKIRLAETQAVLTSAATFKPRINPPLIRKQQVGKPLIQPILTEQVKPIVPMLNLAALPRQYPPIIKLMPFIEDSIEEEDEEENFVTPITCHTTTTTTTTASTKSSTPVLRFVAMSGDTNPWIESLPTVPLKQVVKMKEPIVPRLNFSQLPKWQDHRLLNS